MRFSILIFSNIFISVKKLLLPLAMLQEIFKKSFVFGYSTMIIKSLSILFVLLPLTLVIIPLWRFPFSKSIFFALFPFSLKLLTVFPYKFPFCMSLALLKMSYKNAIFILFASLQFYIMLIYPFINLFL